MVVTPREKRWILIFAGCVALITTIPYLLAYFRQGSDWVFTGFLFGVEDGNSYIAKMLSGWNGAWLFKTPYTIFPQSGLFLFIPYLLLGKLASPPALHEQLVSLFHVFRLVGILFYCFGSYSFISIFISNIKFRWLGILLATFGGGLGWLLILSGNNQFAGSLPLEYYSPETFGFLEVFGLPHLAVARGALLIALATFLTRQGIKSSVATGLWLLLAGIMQPLSALIGCFVILLGLIVEWLRILFKKKNINGAIIHSFRSLVLRAVIAVVIASPIIIYNILISFTDPFMRAWTIQNRILSPSPIHYVVAYILILPFAVVGIRRAVVNWEWKWGIILGWVITFPILAYFPHNLQRRLPEGVWVAWIVLGLAGLEGLKLRRQYSYLFALAFPSTLILFAGSLLQAMKPAEPIFVPREEAAAYVKMSNEFPTTQTVLAAYQTSNAIPAWAPVRVLIGHGPESIGLSNMQPLAEAFYRANTSDQQRQNFIVQNRINLIYWGPSERALGAWNPESSPFLQLAFKINDISVFRVANLMTQRNQ